MSEPQKTGWVALGATVVLGIAALLAADGWLAHGYTATWYAESPEGERVVVDTTTEHRVLFPNVYRPLARYQNGWPHDVLPRPTGLPPIDAALRARLTVPEGPPMHLAADVDAEATIWADGEPLEDRALAPGEHDLWIHWSARPQPHPRSGRRPNTARFELRWGPAPDPNEPVPAAALVPADGGWPTGRLLLWLLGLPFVLLLGWLAYRAGCAPGPVIRARRWGLIATLLIVLLSVLYRGFDYDVMPEFRENGDELFATWNGWSLLEDGTPRGWSLWANSYGGVVEVERVQAWSQTWFVISPYFEHPPLTHVLIGAAAHLGGAEHWLDAKLTHTRVVPIILMAISTWLLILVARRYCPEGGPAPYLGGLIFAVMPVIAMQTRVVKEESMLVPLGLGMVLFFLRWREHKKLRDLIGAGLCAGLATLAKIPAIVWIPAVTMLVAAEQGERKRAFLVAAIGFGAASLVLIYAAAIDIEVFFITQGKQGTRPTHWNLFPRFLDHAQINHNHVGRGWILFLWVGYLYSVASRGWRGSAPLTVPFVTYLCAIAIGAGNWTFGWYFQPLYPFLCIGAGDFLARLWKKPNLLAGTLFVVLLVMYTLNFTMDPTWAKQPPSWPEIRRMVTLTAAAFLVPYALVQVWPRREDLVQLARAATFAGLTLFVVASGYFIVHYDTIYETHHNFDLDEYWTP